MRTAILLTFALISVTQLNAQTAESARSPAVFLGANFVIAEPQEDFRNYVNTSFGGSLNAVWSPGTQRTVGLRVEAGAIGYGNETMRVPLSPTVGRVTVDVTTSNFIMFAHAGPQFTLTRGAIQPYVAPSLGFAYLATVSSVSGDDSESFAQDTNYDDLIFSYGATGGVLVPVARGKVPVSLDLSLRYHRNGPASYLVEGGIRDNSDGTVTFEPIRSNTDLLTFQIGASIGIRRSKSLDER